MASISILIPSYKRGEILFEAINSAQKLIDCKIYICFDSLNDSNVDIIREEYPEIIAYSKENGGISSTRNFLINNSESKYILFLDDDDLISEEFITWWNNHYKELRNDVYKFNCQISDGTKIIKNIGYKMSGKYLSKMDYFNTMHVSSFLIKRTFYLEKKLHFNEICLAEDHSFSADIYKECKSIINTKINSVIFRHLDIGRLTNELSSAKIKMYLNEVEYLINNSTNNSLYIPLATIILRWLTKVELKSDDPVITSKIENQINFCKKKKWTIFISSPMYYKFLLVKFLVKY